MPGQHSREVTFAEFLALVEKHPDGVVLLEGRRGISAEDAVKARETAQRLAQRFPRLRFRSGNAKGSDEAFASGVADVDPSRLQLVLPYGSHRRKTRIAAASYDSPESLSAHEESGIAYLTSQASPQNSGLIEKRHRGGPVGAKAAYLMRDTMKVCGHSERFPKPIAALFHVDPADPSAGGTGHTIRACVRENVPHAFQSSWHRWEI